MKAIHPGEHLAEELREMGLSAAELSRAAQSPDESRDTDFERAPVNHGRHGFTACALFRYKRGVLAESAKSLRDQARSEKVGRSNQGTANDQRSSIRRLPVCCFLTFAGIFTAHVAHGTSSPFRRRPQQRSGHPRGIASPSFPLVPTLPSANLCWGFAPRHGRPFPQI